MNKKQVYADKMIALLLIAYAVGVVIVEKIRDALYGGNAPKKWQHYSGLFILLKRKPRLPSDCLGKLASSVLETFTTLVHPPPVRTLV